MVKIRNDYRKFLTGIACLLLVSCIKEPVNNNRIADNPEGEYTTVFRKAYFSIKEKWGLKESVTGDEQFTISGDRILKDGEDFIVKGIVYVPFYPGMVPWDIENSSDIPIYLKGRIERDIANIVNLGANTIRLWSAPEYCYDVIKRCGSLNILQVIWIDGNVPDLQDNQFKNQVKANIRKIVSRVYSAWPMGNAPILGFNLGNEISSSTILSTNKLHPDITSYTGSYISTENVLTASEAFIAEMADYLKSFENSSYGRTSLVTYSNYIYTSEVISVPFLDFRSFNVYSYDISSVRPGTAPGTTSGTKYQGWIEELKLRHPDIPLLITETGLSVSPNASHLGPPEYGYGGNTEDEQSEKLLQNITDIITASSHISGVCIHEYIDAWWKFSIEDSYTQDPDDVEEWFGITGLIKS